VQRARRQAVQFRLADLQHRDAAVGRHAHRLGDAFVRVDADLHVQGGRRDHRPKALHHRVAASHQFGLRLVLRPALLRLVRELRLALRRVAGPHGRARRRALALEALRLLAAGADDRALLRASLAHGALAP
jgi:hypothetical protein